MLLWLFSLLLGFSVDALWVFYTRAVSNKRKLEAVMWTMLIATTGILGWLNALSSVSLFIPYVIGMGIGTYVAMVIDDRRQR